MTGLESGEYVEILAGISEGDEIVTSAQFLIDSEASLAGSIKRLESVERQYLSNVSSARYLPAAGSMTSTWSSERIRVSHGPIDVLGWPSMTMVFDALEAASWTPVKWVRTCGSYWQEHRGESVLETIHRGASDATGVSRRSKLSPADHDDD